MDGREKRRTRRRRTSRSCPWRAVRRAVSTPNAKSLSLMMAVKSQMHHVQGVRPRLGCRRVWRLVGGDARRHLSPIYRPRSIDGDWRPSLHAVTELSSSATTITGILHYIRFAIGLRCNGRLLGLLQNGTIILRKTSCAWSAMLKHSYRQGGVAFESIYGNGL